MQHKCTNIRPTPQLNLLPAGVLAASRCCPNGFTTFFPTEADCKEESWSDDECKARLPMGILHEISAQRRQSQ